MDRRLLFPAIAATALAQTSSPATARAEKALRARAEQFYQFEVDGKFRNAEALVAKDTRDYYFDNGKPSLRAFKIDKVEFIDKTHAIVTLIATVIMTAPALAAREVPVTAHHTWKLENGNWVWYIDQGAGIDTPFGKMNTGGVVPSGGGNITMKGPSPESLQSLITIDRRSIILTDRDPVQTVTISNGLPGPISLTLGGNRINGLVAELEKNDVKAGEKASVRFGRTGEAKPSGIITVTASPLNVEFEIQIKTE